ncbi:TrbI/VirB10 family protein [Hydrocarboniclastica marina]|uniref:Conjugal transfer protein TraB n=1 Tax=Hydrocarboniclastica marina TaxID=2259620 RepID=A0A4P7XM96_9ALTE|nr:TrbI/VirB10 family protein [Hydrocarboniclastica marina]QCF28135.1 conjugal transfer protein TraB [Hydrocarboniclastica marina]
MAYDFRNMSPKAKQWSILALGSVALIFVIYLFADSDTSKKDRRDETVISNVLTDNNTRSIGIDAMAVRLDSVESELRKREREFEQAEQDLKKIKESTGVGSDVAREVAKLKETIVRMNKENTELRQQQEKITRQIREGDIAVPSIDKGKPGADEDAANDYDPRNSSGRGPVAGLSEEDAASRYFRDAPVPSFGNERNTTTDRAQGGEQTQSSNLAFEDVAVVVEVESRGDVKDDVQDDGIYIPSGSLLTGTLLTGLDAPTGQGARRDPFPVVLRIQKEAILPNQFLADVRECMVIMSGYGDLSSERVYLRSEGVSCVRDDGKSIEARLEGYAVGEDGKAGMRGRLVTKQGQMIARSMTAGFMSGVAGAFDVNPVPVINTNPQGNSMQYLDAFSEESVQSGIVGGASSALERIADFYLELANSIYPVLELDAGRQIDVVMVKGAKLQIQ